MSPEEQQRKQQAQMPPKYEYGTKMPAGAATSKPPPATTFKAPPPAEMRPPQAKPPPGAKATSTRASSRGKTQLPQDRQDGTRIKYGSKYKDLSFEDPFDFGLIPATAIRFRKERNTYFGEIQPNVSSPEVRSFHMRQMIVQDVNRGADNWHKNNAYNLGETARRSMIPVPEPLLVTLASFDHDAARSMFSKKMENGLLKDTCTQCLLRRVDRSR
eukprot:2524234-Amphidinium_carterae.1